MPTRIRYRKMPPLTQYDTLRLGLAAREKEGE